MGWQFNYFKDKPLLTTAEFPNDLDTTSLALSTLHARPDQVQAALNGMLEVRHLYVTLLMFILNVMCPIVCQP